MGGSGAWKFRKLDGPYCSAGTRLVLEFDLDYSWRDNDTHHVDFQSTNADVPFRFQITRWEEGQTHTKCTVSSPFSSTALSPSRLYTIPSIPCPPLDPTLPPPIPCPPLNSTHTISPLPFNSPHYPLRLYCNRPPRLS